MTTRRFWALMGLTLAACVLFAVAIVILTVALWPQKRSRLMTALGTDPYLGWDLT